MHTNKTQEFNQEMNVIQINLEINMGMNVTIHLHYGWFFLNLHVYNIYKIFIKIMDECFILSLSFYQQIFFSPNFI
jgi:hypothetical protein